MSWPIYRSHDDVICFQCGATLGPDVPALETENAPGHGRYRKACSCGLSTWYDVLRVRELRQLRREWKEKGYHE